MRKKKGIRSLNIILILTTLDIGASISDRPSLAMFGRPYFLYLDFYCSFYSSLCNLETVNARKIVSANSAGHGAHWTIINSLLPLSLLLLQPAAAQIQCGSHGHYGHHSSLHIHWVETGPGTSLHNAVCYCIYPRTFRCQNQDMF